MASWDDEDFEPPTKPVTTNDQWDGEDEDDNDIKDNWDDDEEEEKERDGQVPKSQPKKKKTLTEKIAEREEKRRQEALAKQQLEEPQELTPEEETEEKVRRQRLQEEADLEIAKDAFGVVELPAQKTIDNFMPSSKEEFTELSNMIVQKLAKLEVRSEYSFFLETLVRDCCAGCEAEEIKKISNTLNLLVQEKQKLNKAVKGKKKAEKFSKKTLAVGKGMNDELEYDAYGYDEFDDFM